MSSSEMLALEKILSRLEATDLSLRVVIDMARVFLGSSGIGLAGKAYETRRPDEKGFEKVSMVAVLAGAGTDVSRCSLCMTSSASCVSILAHVYK